MEGQKGRLINNTANRLSCVAAGAAHKLHDVAAVIGNGLVNVGEAMSSTREISIKEGLPIVLWVFAGVLGIAAVYGAINREITVAEGETIFAAASAATGAIIRKI
jgi:hypothetical protein